MKLGRKTLEQITNGIMEVKEDEKGFRLHRFTQEQRTYQYTPENRFYFPSFQTNSVSLDFITDSRHLHLILTDILDRSTHTFCGMDLYQDGVMTHHLELPKISVPKGEPPVSRPDIEANFDLLPGTKRVELFLPSNLVYAIREISLDDGAKIETVQYDRTILAMGDSITASSVVHYPSLAYLSRTTRNLNARLWNFSIGGEVFSEKKIVPGTYPQPDMLLIAYGTNGRLDPEKWQIGLEGFFAALDREFPDTPAYVILPIHRMGEETPREGSLPLPEARRRILAECAKYPRVTVLHGERYVPFSDTMYTDGLHPNDLGHVLYSEALTADLKKLLSL